MSQFCGLDRTVIFLDGSVISMTQPAYWVGNLNIAGADALAIDALARGMSVADEGLLNRAVLMQHIGRL